MTELLCNKVEPENLNSIFLLLFASIFDTNLLFLDFFFIVHNPINRKIFTFFKYFVDLLQTDIKDRIREEDWHKF
jgi:hypothetical protein